MAIEETKQSSISSQLVFAFLSVGLLMLLGEVIGLIQLNTMRERAEYMYQADQPARAVLFVRSAFLSYQNELQQLSNSRDAGRFAEESNKLLESFQSDVQRASQAVKMLPPSPQRDSELSSLETVRTLLEGQIESLTSLAQSGDWVGVRLRIENRMPVINALSASLVHDIDAIVEIEKKSGLQQIRRTETRAIWTLAITSLLALIMAGLLGLRVTRNIAGRLEHLDAAARALSAGDFQHQVAVGGNDEIARLSNVFNQMAAQLSVLYDTLRGSEAHFRALIENAPDFILVLNAQQTVTYASPSSVREFGPEALQSEKRVLDLVYPADGQAMKELLSTSYGPAARGPAEIRVKNQAGATRILEVYSRNLLGDPSVSGIVLNARDITNVKALEEQLRQSQRLEAVGTLAGGIAHDFNNLLTVIRGYSGALLESSSIKDDVKGQVRHVDQAAERAAALTHQLLAFSRRQVLEPKVFNVNSLVANIDKMLRRMIGEDIEMATVLDPNLGLLKADPGQIEQVVMNLVINSRDAMPNGGKLTLETGNVDLDENYVNEHSGATVGSHVVISVSDTGEGMDSETLKRIFEPFFTTKREGKGTGLGLSTVYGIVKQSGGHIGVYSELGRGTSFKIYLPRVFEAAQRYTAPQQPRSLKGKETILVAEDDPQIRELVRMSLNERGYKVLAPSDVKSALAQSREYSGSIELLITDVVMPGMSGRELANDVLSRRPDIRVLYVSGYTTNAIVHHGILDENTNFLQKPFTLIDLARKVREVLDAEKTG